MALQWPSNGSHRPRLPVPNITIPYAPRALMVPFHERTQRDANLICHRRFGKTVGICNDGQRRALLKSSVGREHAPPRFAWMYPTRVRAKDIAWGYLKYYSRSVPGAYPIESELAIQYPNGARFTLYGADNRRGVGLYLDGIYYDEDDEIMPQVHADIAPTLSDYLGFEVHAGMLRGRHNLWKRHERMKNNPEVFNLLVRASESRIIPDDELAKLRVSMGEAAYDIQMECNPNAAIANAIYGRQMDEMRRDNRITKVAVDPTVPLDFFCDVGHSLTGDDWSFWGIQLVRLNILLKRYFARTGELPAWYAAKMIEVWDELGLGQGTVYLPHDGAMKDRQGRTAKDDLEAAGIKRVRIVSRNPNLWDGINRVRALMPRMTIDHEGCGETWMLGETEMPSGIDCLDFYSKKEEATTGLIRDVPVHNQYSHGADALRTFADADVQRMLEGTSDFVAAGRVSSIKVTRERQFDNSGSRLRMRVTR